ncbi:CCA tRNA nucleotidyltransferase [Candidatus Woesearchaeota archaeon CG10_big_fil_rev_8_21_14_0_10_32_9]|nr:MAG: CCA tRNA nucleotidyltransferase [Candidatus Woesearchaeota archaeon CG10_big_fil_rev_8_21_14_0_10_32_9]
MDVKNILEQVKKELRPDEKSSEKAREFVKLLNITLSNLKINAKAELGGSLAKGTHLKNKHDADIFVRFSKEYRGKNISEPLKKVLKKLKITFDEVHGSRDYYQVKKEVTYEIVPVMFVENYKDADNVVDMSPLHVKYFELKVKQNKKIRDEIRLTKQFMKVAKAYGAESYIQGFSGHVVDLLIINYGSFERLIKTASKWKHRTIIDIEKYHKFPEMSLNSSKILGPLIVVDPVQKNRNAAAAVSIECYTRFKKACKEFIKKPSLDAFRIKTLEEEFKLVVSKKKEKICQILVKPLNGKRDVIGAKALKIKEYLDTSLKKNDFEILWTSWDFSEKETKMIWIINKQKLSDTIILEGPLLEMKSFVLEFKKKHKKTIIKKDRLYAEEKRKYYEPGALLKDLIKNKYVKEKCGNIKIIES